MNERDFKEFIIKNIDFKQLVKNHGIYEFRISDKISLGISYEDIDNLTDIYIYNLFYGNEYINISGYATIDDLIPDTILNELAKQWQLITKKNLTIH